ncbi:MAG: alpha-1,4-glucan--maltose-1-phosphate maltosyltransferase [Chloroflexota bacterium]
MSEPNPVPPPRRVVIGRIYPEIDGGRFPVKRVVGERVTVEADIFADGHDELACELLYRKEGWPSWQAMPMVSLGNDRWRAEFTVGELGRYFYTVRAWVDRFKTWRRDLRQRLEAGQDLTAEWPVGAELVEAAARRAEGADRRRLLDLAQALRTDGPERVAVAFGEELDRLMGAYPDLEAATRYDRELAVIVDPVLARFGAWYEMFPRSVWSTDPEPHFVGGKLRHGTFRDCETRLEYIAGLGFDVVYLPPIYPIGRTNRKGRNNSLTAGPDDPGSPWAIGGPEGGHTAVHWALGTLEDFRRLVAKARTLGLEVALDLAFHCSPDHPYVREHPEWFRRRPDGTIRYAENPPKKYEDIYPFDFETPCWTTLWAELKAVVEFWVGQGVRIFRVDNPHTKPFAFWEWLIGQIKAEHPDVIFLSEAFTRPKVMYHLAKLGFSQSYTYFAWRNTKPELTEYLTELTRTEIREYFRPNLWPNTPDILTEYLQRGGRPAFMVRFILAATLSASYGIYGPAFELCLNVPREPGSEEYLDSEKYELKYWRIDDPASLRDLIGRVNRIRRENPALHANDSLRFHPTDNDQLICYSKHTPGFENLIVVVVNLDPHHVQAGTVDLQIHELGLDPDRPYLVHDLLTGASYTWHGWRNYVELNPHTLPAHIFRVERP